MNTMKSATIMIAAACAICFVLQYVIPSITGDFALASSLVLSRPWTLVTSMFLHGSPSHILYNMFALIMFGLILESIIGSKKFLTIYFTAGLIASIGAAIFYPASLGASGAIFGILGCLAVLRPKMVVFIGMIPMPMFIAAIVWASIDLFGMFSPGEVANAAHLFGLAAGLLIGFSLRRRYGEHQKTRTIQPLSDDEIMPWENKWL